MKTLQLLVLLILGSAQVTNALEDYSNMSVPELHAALVEAVKEHNSKEVQKILQAGADYNQTITYTVSRYDCPDVDYTCTLLEYAAKNGYTAIVKEFLDAYAAQQSYRDKLKNLLLRKANEGFDKALFYAAKEAHVAIVRALIQVQPTVDGLNKALLVAAQEFPGITTHLATGKLSRTTLKEYVSVIKELIKAGAQADYTNEYGQTALTEVIKHSLYTDAQKKDKARIIEALIQAGADVNCVDRYGDTILIKAIKNYDFDTVQILLKTQEVAINHVTKDGNTPAIVALQYLKCSYIQGNSEDYNECVQSQKIIEVILNHPNVDLSHVNNKGQTAISLMNKIKNTSTY